MFRCGTADELREPAPGTVQTHAVCISRQAGERCEFAQRVAWCVEGQQRPLAAGGLAADEGELRVQYRLFVDGVRHRKRSPIALIDGEAAVAGALSEDPGPEELTAQSQRHEQLDLVWGELNRGQRALLALHAAGHTLGELEAITGLSRNAIGVRLHRARGRLAELVGRATTKHLKEG
jgi:hypothetical protein